MTRLEAIAAAKQEAAKLARMWRNECDTASIAISGERHGGVIVLPWPSDFKFEKAE